MQTKKKLTDTKLQLQLAAKPAALLDIKEQVVKRLGRDMKIPGFRSGKVPLPLIEKHLDAGVLQTEVLEAIVSQLYADAVRDERIRPVGKPEVNITKFVPYTAVECTIEIEAVGDITLPDYTKVKLERKPFKVTAKDVDSVLTQLRTREADKKDVKRAAKDGDQVWIDFTGVDSKTKEPLPGAAGKDFPLVLGSNTFIPGFESELVGLKPGDEKTFKVTFPDQYGVPGLQGKNVTFTCTVNKVQELVLPKVDDEFAAKIGPFKTVEDLKADIKKQLLLEGQRRANDEFERKLMREVSAGTTVAIPTQLIDEQIDRLIHDEQQNVTYRGQTWEEYLKSAGATEEEYRESKRSQAEEQVKMGLVLSEVADQEGVAVTPQEFEERLQQIKNQYKDEQMQAELDKLENRRDILSRMIAERTIAKLASYVA